MPDERAHLVGERDRGVAEVVAAPKADHARRARDEPAIEQPVELLQIHVGQRDAMAELVTAHGKAAMADRSLIDRARAHAAARKGRRAPSSPTTRSALRTPSS